MKSHKKSTVVVVMPGYNVGGLLKKTVAEIPKDIVTKVILVDDGSRDDTAKVAKALGLEVYIHPHNLGYGGAQKTGYWEALKKSPDVVAMIHADFQHDASYLGELVKPILAGRYDMVFGSRTTTRESALLGGMPLPKYLISRMITRTENFILGTNFSEYLCGFRAYSKKTLETVPFQRLTNGYAFDPQFQISAIALKLKIDEIPIPTRYSQDAGSINTWQGIKLLSSIAFTLFLYVLFKANIYQAGMFKKKV